MRNLRDGTLPNVRVSPGSPSCMRGTDSWSLEGSPRASSGWGSKLHIGYIIGKIVS